MRSIVHTQHSSTGTSINSILLASGENEEDALEINFLIQLTTNMTDKIALVTGSTDGLGHCVATRLALDGVHVLIHGRSTERAASLMRVIQNAGGKSTFYQADLSTLAGVRSLASAVALKHNKLDLLVNNAGIGVGKRGSSRQITPDGFELRFAVNYLAGFVLTRMLLPLLLIEPHARIVNVASIGQQSIGTGFRW
jgi:NAD(P)-dependent dehydrogenase (short-subunit alcohol dehydrogenase family)